MKTTIDLPDDLLERTKISAARRRTSIKRLVIEGLEKVLNEEITSSAVNEALARLERGIPSGGKMLTRDEAHAR